MKKRMKLSSLISLIVLVIFSSCAKNDVTTITLNKTTSYLIIGQTDSIKSTLTSTGDIKKIPQVWTSSNNSIATVTTEGIVTGIGAGTAVISVKAGEKTVTCLVTVDDKILPNLTQGELWYYGDAYGTKDSINGTGSNNYILYLASSGINMDNLNGFGEILIVELNTSLSVKDSIPVGIYDMMTDLSKITNFAPHTLVPGYVDSNTAYPWGCWYFGIITAPVSSGNMNVTRLNNIFTINYVFFDDYGVKISGTYHGAINYKDGTLSASQMQLKTRFQSKPVNVTKKAMKFKRR